MEPQPPIALALPVMIARHLGVLALCNWNILFVAAKDLAQLSWCVTVEV